MHLEDDCEGLAAQGFRCSRRGRGCPSLIAGREQLLVANAHGHSAQCVQYLLATVCCQLHLRFSVCMYNIICYRFSMRLAWRMVQAVGGYIRHCVSFCERSCMLEMVGRLPTAGLGDLGASCSSLQPH